MRHLVLLSGGPDSALALKLALTTTEDPVVALHVSLHDAFGRWRMERQAADAITRYCRARFRAFDLETAACKFHGMRVIADLPLLAPFAAGLITAYGDIGKVWMGLDDDAEKPAERRFLRALEACVFPERHGVPCPAEHFPEAGVVITKRETRARLGETLWHLTWSCRMPQDSRPCGACYACRNRRRADAAP